MEYIDISRLLSRECGTLAHALRCDARLKKSHGYNEHTLRVGGNSLGDSRRVHRAHVGAHPLSAAFNVDAPSRHPLLRFEGAGFPMTRVPRIQSCGSAVT